MALISEFFFSSSSRRFLGERKKSRMRSMSMVGHSHEQKARPNTSTSAAISTSDTTARGIMVFVAIMVPRAPKGHSIENVSQPKPDIVPMLTPAISPAAMPTNTTAPTSRAQPTRLQLRGQRVRRAFFSPSTPAALEIEAERFHTFRFFLPMTYPL